jgi:phosphate transport system permease protein
MLSLMVGVLTFTVLFVDMAIQGVPRLNLDFFTSFPSRRAANAGILSAWVGTILVMLLTALAAVPLGVAAGVYLEEYAPKNWMTDIIEINISNLAGIPSIVYGLLALGLFVYYFGFGQSILSAGLTLALLILPVIIVATREAIRAIPQMIHEGSYACGATTWQTVSDHILPYSSARHPDRRHHRHGACHRRDGADHHHRRVDLHRLPAAGALHRRAAGGSLSTGSSHPLR